MPLGLGLNINKDDSLSQVNGVLTDLNINSCVMSFSPLKKLNTSYDGYLVRVYKVDTLEYKYFGYNSSGDIDKSQIMSWLGSSVGVVTWTINESNPDKSFYQNNVLLAPIIYNGAEFQDDGLLFGTNKYMILDDYSQLQLINPEISIYTSFTRASEHIGFVFSRNLDDSNNIQFGSLNFNAASHAWWNGNSVISESNQETNHDLATWQNKLSSGFKFNSNGNESVTTFNVELTNVGFTQIGARKTAAGYSSYFDGNIKTALLCNSDIYDKYDDLAAVI